MKCRISSLLEFTDALKGQSANGVSVKPGGEIQNLILSGGIVTHGDKVTSLEIEGKVTALSAKSVIVANGVDSTAVVVSENGQIPLSQISVLSKQGVAVRIRNHGKLTAQDGLGAKGAGGDIVTE